MRSATLSLGALAVLAACFHRGEASSASGSPPASPAKGTLAIGERITEPVVALADIALSPASYANGVIATRGEVTAVCQEMGCWMELRDASGQAHVRMHGHSFFVPRSAAGHMARVQATVLARPADTECEEGAAAPGRPVARVDLDATGVELD